MSREQGKDPLVSIKDEEFLDHQVDYNYYLTKMYFGAKITLHPRGTALSFLMTV
jgi:hypothetical protein